MDKVQKHSSFNINSELNLAILGSVNVHSQVDTCHVASLQRHNEKISQNRYIVKNDKLYNILWSF
jgi:hypothetical protein